MNLIANLIFRQFWLLSLIIEFLTALIITFRASKEIRKNPNLRDGYKRFITGYLIFFSLPWLVMGAGMTVGKIPDLAVFFFPRTINIYLVLFLASIVLVWASAFVWIFLKGGAEFLSSHPAAWSRFHSSE